MMKTVLLVTLLAAAATAAVVSNKVVELPDANEVALLPDAADVDVNEAQKPLVTNVDREPTDVSDADGTAVDSRRNLSVGTICSALIYNYEHLVNGTAPGHSHVTEIRVEAKEGWIAAVRVTRIGTTQNATPTIASGGVGSSYVTIRIRSAAGRGFHYRVEVYELK